ncbi:C4-dicarboxylate ABC transporter [Tepiditoga spiralis]|uniref:C4-dicarboxylate ABC transporter n=1 Tax=Tepiditoga spiralis TaxID=2108365 RepID=A0A7G1G9M8_9BACT|nr:YfcC family protein [Tepiditoga spiralis]BBE31683.1 C4-dicarboxylate ABC transporter [Tepiditoga spiralis]
MKKFKMPTAYTILMIIIAIVAIMTWVVPTGNYDYVDPNASKLQPIPGTYHSVPKNPQGIGAIIKAPIDGFYDAVDVALFVIVIGGFLGVVMKTGAVDAGIASVTKKLKGREKLMIPILMILFGLGGTTFGMCEETIAFYPLIIPVFIAAGYDAITAVAVIMLGAGVGVLASTVNPFATGIASGFANISLGEGIGLRLFMLIVGEAITIFYVMKYAKKVKQDPSKSLVADMFDKNKEHFLHAKSENDFPELNGRRKAVLWIFAATFIVMVYGVIPFSDIGITAIPTLYWWFGELTTLFFVSAVIIGIVYGMKEEELVGAFINGARDLLGVAIIIGVARGITIVMNNGNITDTILHLGEGSLAKLSSSVFAIVTYLFYLPLSFLIPSTSGLATLSMPIMAPLGDFAHVSRDIIITAYQSANGILNLFTPTSAVVMGGLAIARVPYGTWLKFLWKLLAILFVFSILSLVIGVAL